MKSDIEIAQSAKLKPINEIAQAAASAKNILKTMANTRLRLI
jgi:formyltetrahydrofolate synthetase